MDFNKEGDIVIMKKNSKTNNMNNQYDTFWINDKSEMIKQSIGNLKDIKD